MKQPQLIFNTRMVSSLSQNLQNLCHRLNGIIRINCQFPVHDVRYQHLVFCLIFLFRFIYGFGQDLSDLKSQKPFDVTGNLSLGASYYHNTSPSYFRASPSSYFIQGRVNFSFYGIQVPLSLTYRDAQSSFSGPFQRIGISPSYKWIKIHAGYSSVSFSPYILSGMPVLGGGFELTPKKLRLGFIAGSVQSPKFIADAAQENISWIQTNKRYLQTYKLGFGTNENYFDFILLHGRESSSYSGVPDSLVSPASSNLALGIQAQLTLLKNILHFRINAAASAMSRNNFASLDSLETNKSWYKWTSRLFPVNQSSRASFAGDMSLDANFKGFQIGIKYDRIDPQYASFGSYYFRDDYENYTINTGFGLFKSRLFVNGSFGLSRNNLLQQRLATSLQRIYQINVNAQISKHVGLNALMTNFNFNQEPSLTQIDDSLKFVQVSKNYMLAPYVNLGNKVLSHFFQASYNSQQIQDIQLNTTNHLSALSFSYNLRHKPSGISAVLVTFHNENNFHDELAKQNGMSVSMSKSFLKNKYFLRTRINLSKNSVEGQDDGSTFGALINGSARILSKYSLNLQLGMVKKTSLYQRSYQEFRANTTINLPLNKRS